MCYFLSLARMWGISKLQGPESGKFAINFKKLQIPGVFPGGDSYRKNWLIHICKWQQMTTVTNWNILHILLRYHFSKKSNNILYFCNVYPYLHIILVWCHLLLDLYLGPRCLSPIFEVNITIQWSVMESRSSGVSWKASVTWCTPHWNVFWRELKFFGVN